VSVLNESAQWALLLVIGATVLGLYRQLGNFLLPRKEQLALNGPELGQQLPMALLGDQVYGTLREAIGTSAARVGLIAVITEGCPGCGEVIHRVSGRPEELDGVPIAFVVASASPTFVSELPADQELVVTDEDHARSHEVGIQGWPFLLAVDHDMRVVERQISSDIVWIAQNAAAVVRSDTHVPDALAPVAGNHAGV
jgi:hypothetical protein